MLSSLYEFLKVVAGFEFPQKIGSRVGSVLISNDFKRVFPTGALTSYRDVTYRILDQVYRKYYFSRIYPLMKTNMQWARNGLEEVEAAYHRIAMSCPNMMVREFILGMKMSIHKLKFAAVMGILYDEMPSIVCGFNRTKFQKRIIEQKREEAFLRLVSINLESLEKVATVDGKIEKTEEYAKSLKKRFPSLSVADVALFMDISKTTAHRFLKSKDSDDAEE
jgi:hypothetical protein